MQEHPAHIYHLDNLFYEYKTMQVYFILLALTEL